MPVKQFEPAYLRESFQSILRQTHPGWRLLIIAEPDSRDALVRELGDALDDERISICLNEGNKLAGALNTGMRRATTPFVAILLADDVWEPHAVAVLTEHIDAHPAIDFFHSSRIIIDDRGVPISSIHRSVERFEVADFLLTSPVKHLLCWRRAKGLDVGGIDESLSAAGADDYDFPWTMAERGAAFMPVHESLYRYRDHRSGVRLTTHVPAWTHLLTTRRMFKKHGATGAQIRAKLLSARRTYVRESLYQTPIDKWIRERLGRSPKTRWRDTYR